MSLISKDAPGLGCQGEAALPKPAVIHRLEVDRSHCWGVMLAGGDGTRLYPLTRLIYGDERPKQFCPLTGDQTLFEQTRRLAQHSIPANQLLAAVTAGHRRFYSEETGVRAAQRIVQPANKGTAPAIAVSVLSIQQHDKDALVALLPCDHYYSDENEFRKYLESAFRAAERHRESIVLLGATPGGPNADYGWITLGGRLEAEDVELFRVNGMSEKPSFVAAHELFMAGAIWNTFVMVGCVSAWLSMLAEALPDMVTALNQQPLWSRTELFVDPAVYRRFRITDFSVAVLATQPARLLVLSIHKAGWSNLGRPERVLSVVRESGLEPCWLLPRETADLQLNVAHDRGRRSCADGGAAFDGGDHGV